MPPELYIDSVILDRPPDKRSYLSNIPAVKHLADKRSLSFSKNVTFFVGENGTGKSTLIEAIAVAYGFNPEGGTKNFNFSTNQNHSDLWKHLTLSKSKFAKDGFFLRAESFYNVATNIEEMDKEPSFAPPVINSYGGVSLHHQSHGESFMTLVQNRFSGNGVYILDEPEAALSPMRLLTLIVEIDNLVKKDSQFIIATHSPMLMAFPNAEILEFSESGIKSVDYRDTGHYNITRRFLENPDKMLKYLLDN
jgi:predicted ATPase